MIVLDASVVVEYLLDIPPFADTIARRMIGEAPNLAAPHLLDVEDGQALRRLLRLGDISAGRAGAALDDLTDLAVIRYPHTPLLTRAFELRDNATIYDAVYVALAEALDAKLLTRDAALKRLPGRRAEIELLS